VQIYPLAEKALKAGGVTLSQPLEIRAIRPVKFATPLDESDIAFVRAALDRHDPNRHNFSFTEYRLPLAPRSCSDSRPECSSQSGGVVCKRVGLTLISMSITYRLATLADIPALEELIPLSARQLQTAHYTVAQIEGAIGTVFGVDSQLIRDETYFVAETDAHIVGCGGWSKRKTLYGGDRAKTAPDALRDPATEPAMIRAFFVHPDYARRGIGRRIMELSEGGATTAGFKNIEIVATLPGVPLYVTFAYKSVERFNIKLPNGATMPVERMRKTG
jgi:GNAT superfamily N-acetyltransferase